MTNDELARELRVHAIDVEDNLAIAEDISKALRMAAKRLEESVHETTPIAPHRTIGETFAIIARHLPYATFVETGEDPQKNRPARFLPVTFGNTASWAAAFAEDEIEDKP